MIQDVESLILAQLRAIRADIGVLRDGQQDIRDQIDAVRRRDHARDGESLVHNRRISQLEADMERVKRRLELVDET